MSSSSCLLDRSLNPRSNKEILLKSFEKTSAKGGKPLIKTHDKGFLIKEVSKEAVVYNDPPMKFEAGTPGIVQTIGFGVALDYLMELGMDNVAAHEAKLRDYTIQKLSGLNWLQVQGHTADKAAIFSFTLDGAAHAHDISTILDKKGVAVRAGHPLGKRQGERPSEHARCPRAERARAMLEHVLRLSGEPDRPMES